MNENPHSNGCTPEPTITRTRYPSSNTIRAVTVPVGILVTRNDQNCVASKARLLHPVEWIEGTPFTVQIKLLNVTAPASGWGSYGNFKLHRLLDRFVVETRLDQNLDF